MESLITIGTLNPSCRTNVLHVMVRIKPSKKQLDLRLDQSKSAYGILPESPGKYAITPGNLSKSEVYHRIISTDPEYVMPVPSFHVVLTAKEKAYIIKWIKEGCGISTSLGVL